MKVKESKKPNYISAVLLTAAVIFLFKDPSLIASRAAEGLAVCGNSLIPTLFPFMILSELAVRSNTISYAEKLLSKPMNALFGISGKAGGAFILGICCGFPIGAKTAISLYVNGAITRKDAERVMCFCNCPSYAFTVFAVGEGLFGRRDIGILLYFLIIGSTMIYALVSAPFSRKAEEIPLYTRSDDTPKKEGLATAFTSAMASASAAMTGVCAYVIFFFCLTGALSSLLGTLSATPFGACLFSIFELTSGASACAALDERAVGFVLCAFAGCWSGMSVHLQILSLARGCGCDISFIPYFSAKIICSVAVIPAAIAVTKICPQLFYSSVGIADAFMPTLPYSDGVILASNLIMIFFSALYFYKNLDRRHGI